MAIVRALVTPIRKSASIDLMGKLHRAFCVAIAALAIDINAAIISPLCLAEALVRILGGPRGEANALWLGLLL